MWIGVLWADLLVTMFLWYFEILDGFLVREKLKGNN